MLVEEILAKSCVARHALLPLMLTLSGCTYLESMAQRTASPDDRNQLDRRDGMVLLTPAEISDYTCMGGLVLLCERGGAGTYSCRCER